MGYERKILFSPGGEAARHSQRGIPGVLPEFLQESPVSEIADAAGISKSLLFHYFRNKKELYLYLWDTAARTTLEYLAAYQTYEQPDVFATMRRGLQAKTAIMRRWPDMGAFTIKAYYEKDPEVCQEIQESIRLYGSFETNGAAMQLDPADYRPGLDLEMMYQDMFWASEGYVLSLIHI